MEGKKNQLRIDIKEGIYIALYNRSIWRLVAVKNKNL